MVISVNKKDNEIVWPDAKFDRVREINNKHKKFMMAELGKIAGVSFATIPDADGDSATFLNMFLPNTEAAMKTVDEFNKNGVAGFNYWFTNMYHFINQWNHII